MPNANIDSLSIQVKSSANSASSALDKLVQKLELLKDATANTGLQDLKAQLDNCATSAYFLGNRLSNLSGKDIRTTVSSTSQLTGVFGSLWKALKKVAVVAGTIKLFKEGYGYATDYFETTNYFNNAMGEFSEEAYDYAQTVSDALGLDPSQWMQNQATFMSLAATFGNTADNAYLMSKNLTQLTYDLMSLKNVSPEVAMQKLRSAFAGEIEPLRDWGVDLSKANLQLVALNLGIEKSFSAMTQAEKSQLRYYTIMNQLSYAMGDLTKTLDSPANQLRLLEMSVQKVARAFGNIFIPILNKIIPILIATANAIRALFERIAAFFGFKYPEVTNWDRYGNAVSAVGDDMEDTTGKAKALKKQLAGFDEINNLTTNQGSGGGYGGVGGGWSDFDLPTYESLGKSFLGDALDNRINTVLQELPGKLTGFLSTVITGIQNLDWVSLGKKFGDSLASIDWFGLIYKIGQLIIEALGAVLEFLWGAAKGILWTGGQIVAGIFAGMIEGAKGIVVFLKEHIVDPIVNGIKKLFGIHSPSTVMAGIGQSLVAGLCSGLSNIWESVKGIFTNLWSKMKQGFTDAWTSIKTVFSSIPNWFKEKFTAAWQAVKNVFSTGGQVFAGIKEGIENTFRTIVNAIIRGINTIISKPFTTIRNLLSKIKETSILGLKPFSFINVSWSIPQIPLLATGGIVDNPTMAMIGENGAEAVVPLEHNTEWINRVAEQLNNTGSNNDDVVQAINTLINVVRDKDIIIDGKSLARGLTKEINRQSRLLGEGLV